MPGKADTALQWAISRVGTEPKRQPHMAARFVQQAYRSVGIPIPGTTVGQITNTRKSPISRRQLAPGDIVFADLRSSAIYVGSGMVVGVNARGKVQTKALARFWKASRVTTPGGGIGLSMATPTIKTTNTYPTRR